MHRLSSYDVEGLLADLQRDLDGACHAVGSATVCHQQVTISAKATINEGKAQRVEISAVIVTVRDCGPIPAPQALLNPSPGTNYLDKRPPCTATRSIVTSRPKTCSRGVQTAPPLSTGVDGFLVRDLASTDFLSETAFFTKEVPASSPTPEEDLGPARCRDQLARLGRVGPLRDPILR